jgi:hypothetical protein
VKASLKTPLAFLVFNRADTSARVFREIRKARPSRLLVVADGPRAWVAEDKERCAAVRRLIKVDWPCRVQRLYAAKNMGCRTRISSGLDWVFKEVPEAIILEDDCLPHPQFFKFSSSLLARFRQKEEVMMIGGANFDPPHAAETSFRFSRYGMIWGWASWRRAWKHYDVDLKAWPEFLKRDGLKDIFGFQMSARRFWEDCFEMAYLRKMDTWDYQWTFAIWKAGGLCVVPEGNLISNIGVGELATRIAPDSPFVQQPYQTLKEPWTQPTELKANAGADAKMERLQFSGYGQIFLKSWLRMLQRHALASLGRYGS